MNFLEKDLEEIIYKTYNEIGNLWSSESLEFEGVMKRQLRIGSYGIADLVTFNREYLYNIGGVNNRPFLNITVYELKKDKIGISALLQATQYVKGITEYLKYRNFKSDFKVNIVLIGRSIDTSGSFAYIPDIFRNVEYYTYNYGYDGLEFTNERGYKLTQNGFSHE